MKRRPFVQANPQRWERETITAEDGSRCYRWIPVYEDLDPRIRAALDDPRKYTVLVFRCGCQLGPKRRCGRTMGQVFRTSEGLLALPTYRRPNPFIVQGPPGIKRTKVPVEDEAVPILLEDDRATVTLYCPSRAHGVYRVDTGTIRNRAATVTDWRKPRCLEVPVL